MDIHALHMLPCMAHLSAAKRAHPQASRWSILSCPPWHIADKYLHRRSVYSSFLAHGSQACQSVTAMSLPSRLSPQACMTMHGVTV